MQCSALRLHFWLDWHCCCHVVSFNGSAYLFAVLWSISSSLSSFTTWLPFGSHWELNCCDLVTVSVQSTGFLWLLCVVLFASARSKQGCVLTNANTPLEKLSLTCVVKVVELCKFLAMTGIRESVCSVSAQQICVRFSQAVLICHYFPCRLDFMKIWKSECQKPLQCKRINLVSF